MPVVTMANRNAGAPRIKDRKLRLEDQFTNKVVPTDHVQLTGDTSIRLSIPAVPPAPWMSSPELSFASSLPVAENGHKRIRQTNGRRGPSNPKSLRIEQPITHRSGKNALVRRPVDYSRRIPIAAFYLRGLSSLAKQESGNAPLQFDE